MPELTILVILSEGGKLSGYDINKIITERGFREWAGIGSTSIYSGLKKLEKKNLIMLTSSNEKTGKGPVANKYFLTANGMETLLSEVKTTLSSDAYNDSKFDLALSCAVILSKAEFESALLERKEKLMKNMNRVRSEKFEKQGGVKLPPHVVLLFERTFMLFNTEIDFINKVLKDSKRKRSMK